MSDCDDDNLSKRQAEQHGTLLPSPFAALISLGTATSSLVLRGAGFFGTAALQVARLGTVSGIEVGRGALEAVLAQAGQDVVQTSRGHVGRQAAERAVTNALSSLHYAITNASFLLTAGFQMGAFGVTTGVAITQSLLNLLDAVFGDTDTSKAIATIIAMVQRELGSQEVGNMHETLSVKDIMTGAIGFVLLQRWCREKTQEVRDADQVESTILDIVVIAIEPLPNTSAPSKPTPAQPTSPAERPHSSASFRPASFIAANGHNRPFSAISYDDGASFHASAAQPWASIPSGLNEDHFRQSLMSQLCPGSTVRITSTVTKTHMLTVEIDGDATSYVQPPPGYELVEANGSLSFGDDSQTLVFRRQHCDESPDGYEIIEPPPFHDGVDGPRRLQTAVPGNGSLDRDGASYPDSTAVREKRRRSNNAVTTNGTGSLSQPAEVEKKHPLRTALKSRSSYRNLLDFWNSGSSQHTTSARQHAVRRPERPASSHGGDLPGRATNGFSFEPMAVLAGPQASHSQLSGHKRRSSSVFSVDTTSTSTSMVLHSTQHQEQNQRVWHISREGTLPGQYPPGSFISNTARFSRYATASYGQTFLRLMGSRSMEDTTALVHDRTQLSEHVNFSTYTGLPATTVLLSSFVDPVGGPNASGQAETGLPLIHYISLDHASKAVVVTFRGTLGFEDVLTDLTASYDNIMWEGKAYKAHQGIHASARRFISLHAGKSMATIRAALEEFEDYGLILCGHSLGGAVAAVVGILLAQRNPSTVLGASSFITKINDVQHLIASGDLEADSSSGLPNLLPPAKPIHVYAYGPAAAVSADLQLETTGLITTIVNDMDHVPFLSLGTLRDMHAIAYSFKMDTSGAKSEVRRRVWQGLSDIFRDRVGLAAFGGRWDEGVQPAEDHWPWATLQALRENMNAEKLVPPGEVFIVKSEPVLQRYAFVHEPQGTGPSGATTTAEATERPRSFKPGTHVTVKHVGDVQKRFAEVQFGSSMWTDHMPLRYERVFEALEKGLGSGA